MRRVVAHLHLFKNAGTSVDASLERNFGRGWVKHDNPHDGLVLTRAELTTYLSDRPEIQAVSSHLLRPPLMHASDSETAITLDPIVFLRHPIDRIRSAYDFEARNRNNNKPTDSLRAWIDWHRAKNSRQCNNFQVAALTSLRHPNGHVDHRQHFSAHRESAQQFVSNLPAFGLVERFDDSCAFLNDALRVHHATIALRPRHENRRRRRSKSIDDRLAEVERDLGSDDCRQLWEDNAHDLDLWKWASARFEALAMRR